MASFRPCQWCLLRDSEDSAVGISSFTAICMLTTSRAHVMFGPHILAVQSKRHAGLFTLLKECCGVLYPHVWLKCVSARLTATVARIPFGRSHTAGRSKNSDFDSLGRPPKALTEQVTAMNSYYKLNGQVSAQIVRVQKSHSTIQCSN